MVRVLTLTAPWSYLVAVSEKTIESRSWQTPYRGQIAIHAAKSFPQDARLLCQREPFRSVLAAHGITKALDLESTLGCIIAVAQLDDVIPTQDVSFEGRPTHEQAFGDYTPGRWAWLLSNIRALRTPIPAKGSLGLWEYTLPIGKSLT